MPTEMTPRGRAASGPHRPGWSGVVAQLGKPAEKKFESEGELVLDRNGHRPGDGDRCGERGWIDALKDGGQLRVVELPAAGRPKTGRSPVDRGRSGSKHHVICDATGVPLAVALTGGNRNDITQLMPLLQAVLPIRGKRG